MRHDYDYIVLDLDGTLFSNAKYLRSCRYAAKRVYNYAIKRNVPKALLLMLTEKYMNHGKVTYPIKLISKRYGIDRIRFLNYVYSVNPRRFGIAKDEKLVKLLKTASRNAKLAVFTSTPSVWALPTISVIGLKGVIERKRIVTLETLDNGRVIKPSRPAFLMMLKKLSTKPSRIIFFDDDRKNVEGAKKLGIDAFQICNDKACDVDGHHNAPNIYEALKKLNDKYQ